MCFFKNKIKDHLLQVLASLQICDEKVIDIHPSERCYTDWFSLSQFPRIKLVLHVLEV